MIYGFLFQYGIYNVLKVLDGESGDRWFSTREVMEHYLQTLPLDVQDGVDRSSKGSFYVRIRRFLNDLVLLDMAKVKQEIDPKKKVLILKFKTK